jgi:hypothetical protein
MEHAHMVKRLRKVGNNPRHVSPERFEESLSRVVARRRSALKRLAESGPLAGPAARQSATVL